MSQLRIMCKWSLMEILRVQSKSHKRPNYLYPNHFVVELLSKLTNDGRFCDFWFSDWKLNLLKKTITLSKTFGVDTEETGIQMRNNAHHINLPYQRNKAPRFQIGHISSWRIGINQKVYRLVLFSCKNEPDFFYIIFFVSMDNANIIPFMESTIPITFKLNHVGRKDSLIP